MLKALYFILIVGLCISCQEKSPLEAIDIPAEHGQVLLVTTATWDDSVGTLQLYEQDERSWQEIGAPVQVMVGRNGLAWGRGIHILKQGKEKQEGDGRAPAGIFTLEGAFGYNAEAPDGLKMPYRQATDRDYWIDDAGSPQYNQWVNIPMDSMNDPRKHWDSFERMRREDGLYEMGLIVNHNTSPVTTGKGSAIFMHIWRGQSQPTAGCTAMPKEELLEVMRWLDPKKKPILIQVPLSELDQLKFNHN